MILLYLLPTSLFLVSLLHPSLQVVYALVYFYLATRTIIKFEEVPEDAEHSTVTHYQRKSRWHWVNYALAAYIIFSAVLYLWLPLSPSLLILAAWTGFVSLRIYISRRYELINIAELLADYLQSKFPDLKATKLKNLAMKFMQNPQLTNNERLQSELKLSQSQLEKLLYSCRRYLETTQTEFIHV